MTNKEKNRWLDSRGGRTFFDLGTDDKGEYVWMADGYGGEMKVYLPTVYINAKIDTINK